MDGLRRFNEAVDVGHLRQGTRKFSEDFPEAVIREEADELTLRADEVGTLKAFINIDHIEYDRWRPPLADAGWHTFCQTIYEGIKGDEWEELYCHHRDVSKATGAPKVRVRKRGLFGQ